MFKKVFGDKRRASHDVAQPISYEQLERDFAKMVADLRLPAQAAENMLKMPKQQKLEMLKAHQVKQQTVCQSNIPIKYSYILYRSQSLNRNIKK